MKRSEQRISELNAFLKYLLWQLTSPASILRFSSSAISFGEGEVDEDVEAGAWVGSAGAGVGSAGTGVGLGAGAAAGVKAWITAGVVAGVGAATGVAAWAGVRAESSSRRLFTTFLRSLRDSDETTRTGTRNRKAYPTNDHAVARSCSMGGREN